MATAGKTLATPLTFDTQAPYYKDATELAALIRTKQLSSREVVQAHLDTVRRFGKAPPRQMWCERAYNGLGNCCGYIRRSGEPSDPPIV